MLTSFTGFDRVTNMGALNSKSEFIEKAVKIFEEAFLSTLDELGVILIIGDYEIVLIKGIGDGGAK